MVHSPNKIIETATADTVVVLELPNHIRGLPRKWRIESRCLPAAGPSVLNILHFVSEKKRFFTPASGYNQLVYGLSTALFQKRGLRLNDHFTFGCCTESEEISTYAACWDGEQVRIPIKDFLVF
jgi:hypothetical protein